MIDAIDKLGLLANLSESYCELSHGIDTEKKKAVDYLVVPMGYKESNGIETVTDFLTIPICQECKEAIESNEWILLYCLNCNESQWIIKELARHQYSNNVNFMKYCPKCYKTE